MAKVGLHEKAGEYFVVPGTVVVGPSEQIRFWNSTGVLAKVYFSVPGDWIGPQPDGEVQPTSKRGFNVANNATDGVYEFAVFMDSKLAQGNSAPRIIIDG